jgi:hypothetical protein
VAWQNSGCLVDVAVNVDLGAPPLEWVPCNSVYKGGNFPGCEVTKKTWTSSTDCVPPLCIGPYDQLAAVLRTEKGYRIGFWAHTPPADFTAIYDEAGKPMAAWRERDVINSPPHANLWASHWGSGSSPSRWNRAISACS